MIAVVDYGLGNIQAFLDIYKRLNISAFNARNAVELEEAERYILPGVGSFDRAMERLNASGMREALDRLVIEESRPVLGVCVGMQMMANRSEEGSLPGMGWIPGLVQRFDDAAFNHRTHLPHMGWNDVNPVGSGGLFAGLHNPRFYFLHSYKYNPKDPAHVLARASYGGEFACAVNRGNIYGTQFHPEKSHRWGVDLLANFAKVKQC